MLFLLHRTAPADRNASGIHAVLVDAADEATARALAVSNRPNGGTRVPSTWAAVQVADAGTDGAVTLPTNPLWLEGDAVSLIGITRGGNAI